MDTEQFLEKLTHQEKVNLAFRLMDYIAIEMISSGNEITIITDEYTDD